MLMFFSFRINAQTQFYLSEVWNGLGGEMAMFYRNSSTTDDLKNVYVAGSTMDANNLHDILIQKFSSTGTLIWQQTYNGNANGDDLAADVFVAASGNVNDGNAVNEILYPASFNDKWVIKVGASNDEGDYAAYSVYGNNIDILAPGDAVMIRSLGNSSNDSYPDLVGNGTSLAAPHVSGTAALLHSLHNIENTEFSGGIYPNNLSPEDFEIIMENTTIEAPTSGYSEQMGHGILNAGAALKLVELPRYFVYHRGGIAPNPVVSTVYDEQIGVIWSIDNLAAATYDANRVQVTQTFIDIFEPYQSVLAIWPRYSASLGYSGANPLESDTWYLMNVQTSQNVVVVTTTTWCYFVTSTTSGQTINNWYPAPPNQLKTYYSYLMDNGPTADIDENLSQEITLFPNPTNDILNIDFEVFEKDQVKLTVVDLNGREIAQHSFSNLELGMNSFSINLSPLPSGVYMVTIEIGNQKITRTIVKN